MPQAPEAEAAVLGCILLRPEVLDEVAGSIGPHDFCHPKHQAVYESILRLSGAMTPIDEVTVAEDLRATGRLDAIGEDFLAALSASVGTAENVAYHAEIVRERSLARRLIATVSEIGARTYAEPASVRDLLDDAQGRIFELAQGLGGTGYVSFSAVARETLKAIDRAKAHGSEVGVQTGFADVDKILGSLRGGELIVLAGRPSMGKTGLALNLAVNAAFERRIPSLFFSLEMGRGQLCHRVLAAKSGIPTSVMRSGAMTDDQCDAIVRAACHYGDLLLAVDDSSPLSAMDIRGRARRFASDRRFFPDGPGLGLVVVDYLQLMKPSPHGRGERTREREVAEMSAAMKELAKELRWPVLVLSQLSRASEKREDRRPMLSDLRDSGALEQDADAVLFVHRQDQYQRDRSKHTHTADVIVAKHRCGATGAAELRFDRELVRFDNLAHRTASWGGPQ
jgi:replicative DNA helicase